MATPTLVQQVQTSWENRESAVQWVIPLPNAVLSGNLLAVGFQFKSSLVLGTVQDNGGNNLTAGPTVTNSANGVTLATYYLANDTFGSTSIVVNFTGSGSPARLQAEVSEWYNVATSSPTDGTGSSSTSVTTSSITTSVNGDLVLYWACQVSAGTTSGGGYNGTSITAGSGQTLLSADLVAGMTGQYIVQSTAGAISPTCTPSGSLTWASCAIAFRAASAGTAPSSTAMRIVSVYHAGFYGTVNLGATPVAFPSRGNLLVGFWNCTVPMASLTDSASNNWQLPMGLYAQANSNTAQIVFVPNATTSNTLSSITCTASASTINPILILYDVVNAATDPIGSYSAFYGVQSVTTGTLTPGNSLTPTVTGGIIFNHTAITNHTITTVTSTAGTVLADNSYNTYDDNGAAGTQPSNLDEDNGYAHVYNSTLSNVQFTYTYLHGKSTANGVGAWSSIYVHFMPTGSNLKVPLVQQWAKGAATSGSSVAATFPNATKAGNTIIAICTLYDGATARTVSSVAVSPGSGTFAKIVGQAGSGTSYGDQEAWGAPNIGAGAAPTVTVTASGVITLADVFIYEFSNCPTTLAPEGAAGVAGTSSATMTSPAITTVNTNDIIFTVFTPAGTPSSPPFATGWTGLTSTDTALVAQYIIPGATVSSFTGTATQTGAAVYGATVFAFPAPAANVFPTLSGTISVTGTISPTVAFEPVIGGVISVTGMVNPQYVPVVTPSVAVLNNASAVQILKTIGLI